MRELRQESICGKCHQLLPRASFLLDKRGWLKGAVCKGCISKYRRDRYLARGGCAAEWRARKRYYAKHPWAKTLRYIQKRTNYPGHPAYYGRIKNELTVSDLEYFWYRDGAGKMIVPSIDRIDPEKDYTFDNCRYIELSENIARANESRRKT